MKVTLISCGPVANESESLAFKHLETRLQSIAGEGEWILLTNLAFSVTHNLQSDEIDIVAIGPPGIRVIEVKHWSSQWIEQHRDLVAHEAERVTEKARKVGTTLRRVLPTLPRVEGCFLLTQDASKVKRLSGTAERGVALYSLSDWRAAVGADEPSTLTRQQVASLARTLEPKSSVALDGSLRRFAGYVNLQLTTSKDDRFHRVYKGIHSSRQDNVVLHLYDLSVREEANAEAKARREYETLQRLQLYHWAPRILDSFQDAPGYPGEMFFFTLVDPAAPSLQARDKDQSWNTASRISFAKAVLTALEELHHASGSEPILHRNLTSQTILVRHDNSAILTGFDRAKIPADVTIASGSQPVQLSDGSLAPEILKTGWGSADQRSDVYAASACLRTLFLGRQEPAAARALSALEPGLREDPQARASLQTMKAALGEILGESVPQPPPPPARFWTEEQIIPFRDRRYQIVSRLGSGGIGTTFKVVEIDRHSDEELGTYVAKVGHHETEGHRVLHAYSLARPHISRHRGLSAIFEIATEWHENSFTALMTWIEGTPLRDFIEVFPLLAEEQQERCAEDLALRWLRVICDALSVLHLNGLVHGDVSPRNMIVSNTDLVLTDYDFVGKIGEPSFDPGTVLYCSPEAIEKRSRNSGDDIYALAASFFHVVFGREPFQYGGVVDKSAGLNWVALDRSQYPVLAPFLDKATAPDPARRFSSGAEALAFLGSASPIERAYEPPAAITPSREPESLSNERFERRAQEVPWLKYLLQSYPGSPIWGNQETRGLDTTFAAETYVQTRLEQTLLRDIQQREARLVILCGNAGDGKTALLQHLARHLGFGTHSSSERLLVHTTADGLTIRMNLDGSAAWQGRSADDLMDEFFAPFQAGAPQEDVAHLLAVNDGRLLEWIDRVPETELTEHLLEALEGRSIEASHVRFINLNERSLVGNILLDQKIVDTEFLDRLLDQLYGGEHAAGQWARCTTCTAQDRCEVFRATRLFGSSNISYAAPQDVRQWARKRLFDALQAVHLRGETHVTMRELRAALSYILFGVHFCSDYHNGSPVEATPYWDRAFSPIALHRQGEVLREIARFDPALETHPRLDRHLIGSEKLPSPEARRKAYFEWPKQRLEEIAGASDALGLARGRNLQLFGRIPFLTNDENRELCARLCRGISLLEDLPVPALDRSDEVPLRIKQRTPTETTFWVEKRLDKFRLEAELLGGPELDRLHRKAVLRYLYSNDRAEVLELGAELFHLLLELSDGYQLGDVSTDDTFAHLSIFVQRLIREDERELFAWSPMRDDSIYRIATRLDGTGDSRCQRIVLAPVSKQVGHDII